MFLGILILVIVVAGCTSGGETPTPVKSVFDGGTQGIVASFEPFGVQEAGIFTIFDTETFPIEVTLKNRGEEDVAAGDAKVSLKGINLNDFTGIPSGSVTNKNKIEKVSELDKQGQEELLDFTPGTDAHYKPKVTGFYQPDIFAVAEYKYATHLIMPQICFKEDLKDESVCKVDEAKTFFVSGAPVTVTKVEESAAGRGLMVLLITIENVGGGKVTLPAADFDARYGQVAFTVETEPEKWECRSAGREGEVRLVDGKAVIACKLKEQLAKDTLFTKQIELTLKYRYQSVIQQTIKIKESLD